MPGSRAVVIDMDGRPRPSGAPLLRLSAWCGGSWAFSGARRSARVLVGFARTEAESELELREAAAACSDDRRRAAYLRHALDEARHARWFFERAQELLLASGGVGEARPRVESERLFERLGEMRFLAFVAGGERRGRIQFETYARLLRGRGQASLAELFERIVEDECGHEVYTRALLQELLGAAGASRALVRARAHQALDRFRRAGQSLAALAFTLSMTLLYLAIAPLAIAWRLAVPAARGWSRSS